MPDNIFPGIKLFLLGSPRIEVDGKAVILETRKGIALLAYLAVTRQTQHRDTLAALLWPDQDQTRARGALRTTLSVLHKALEKSGLEITRDSIALNQAARFWLDVTQFQDMVAQCGTHGHRQDEVCADCLPLLLSAVDLYPADFMAGFTLRDSPDFDDWQYLQSETLRRELASALDRLSLGLAAAGEMEEALEQAGRWSNLDILDEDAHRRLMKVYVWAGQRNAALRQYRECMRILEQELSVAPLAETTQLYQAITENQDFPPPALAQRAAGMPGSQPAEQKIFSPVIAAPPERFPLVGRAAELERLRRAYREHGSEGYHFILEGEAGVGKTALADEFLDEAAAQGAVIFRFRCYAGENHLAYAPFVDGLRTALCREDQAARMGQILPIWLSEAARLAPELAERYPNLPAAPPLDGPGENARFYEGVSQVLFSLCDGSRPGVLFFDDLHWADASSLEMLAYLVRRIQGHALFLAMCWRGEDAALNPHLKQLEMESARAGHGDKLRLNRLGKREVEELIRSRQPGQKPLPDSLIKRLYQEAEGLPFFVVEYLAMLANRDDRQAGEVWEIPDSIQELLHSRLAALDDLARQVLAAAAVIGRTFDFDTLHAASGRNETECVTALETLIASGLVREGPVSQPASLEYDFSHEKLHALVYEEASLARRRLLHRRAAEALIGRHERQGAGALAAQIAWHAQRSGQEALAAEYYRQAGDYARRLYANTEALAAYQSALALGHPLAADLYQEIGDLQTLMGEYVAAITSYETAAALCRPGCAAVLESKLANVHHRRGEWDLADAHFQASHDQLGGDEGDPERLARLFADWSRTAHEQGQADRALELAHRSLDLAKKTGEKLALAQAYNILGILARSQGQPGVAVEHLELSLEIARSVQDLGAQTAALNNLALAYGDQEDWGRAIEWEQSALELCTRQGDRHRQAALLNHLADLYHAAGQPEPAMENLKKAVVIFSEIGHKAEKQQPEIWMLTEW